MKVCNSYADIGAQSIESVRTLSTRQDISVLVIFFMQEMQLIIELKGIHSDTNKIRMRDPTAIMSPCGFSLFIFPHLFGLLFSLHFCFTRSKSRHASHGEGPAIVTDVDDSFSVVFHPRSGHGDGRTIG